LVGRWWRDREEAPTTPSFSPLMLPGILRTPWAAGGTFPDLLNASAWAAGDFPAPHWPGRRRVPDCGRFRACKLSMVDRQGDAEPDVDSWCLASSSAAVTAGVVLGSYSPWIRMHLVAGGETMTNETQQSRRFDAKVAVRIPANLLDRLQRLAEERYETLSGLVRRMVVRAVRKMERRPAQVQVAPADAMSGDGS